MVKDDGNADIGRVFSDCGKVLMFQDVHGVRNNLFQSKGLVGGKRAPREGRVDVTCNVEKINYYALMSD